MSFYRTVTMYDPYVLVSENEKAFKQLESAILGSDSFRIVLSGRSGTGKHHLLEELKRKHRILPMQMNAQFMNEVILIGRRRARRIRGKESVDDDNMLYILFDFDELRPSFYEDWSLFLKKKRVLITSKTTLEKLDVRLQSMLESYSEISIEELSYNSKKTILNEYINAHDLNVDTNRLESLLQGGSNLDHIKEKLWEEHNESFGNTRCTFERMDI